jgi:hypothetical protein
MRFFALIFILFSIHAHAGQKFGEGVAASVGFGQGGSTLKNPDDTDAHYKMLTIEAKGSIPLIESDDFATYLTGNMRYLDLKNTANNSAQSEVGNLIGPGAGLHFRLFKFVLGADYNYMIGRYYAVGAVSNSTQYNMPLTSLYGGFSIPFKMLSVSISYSQASGAIPKAESGLSKDVPYTDQIYWIQLTYSTGASFSKFWDYLF